MAREQNPMPIVFEDFGSARGRRTKANPHGLPGFWIVLRPIGPRPLPHASPSMSVRSGGVRGAEDSPTLDDPTRGPADFEQASWRSDAAMLGQDLEQAFLAVPRAARAALEAAAPSDEAVGAAPAWLQQARLSSKGRVLGWDPDVMLNLAGAVALGRKPKQVLLQDF